MKNAVTAYFNLVK